MNFKLRYRSVGVIIVTVVINSSKAIRHVVVTKSPYFLAPSRPNSSHNCIKVEVVQTH
jgi:hypothetical protein